MPPRQQFAPVTLEELPIDEYETDSLLGSDDDLDDTTRAAKRRRIETLGELYLQGKPLLIASASLRGPFENGWLNPWKKNRSRHSTNVAKTNRRVAATSLQRRAASTTEDKKIGVIEDSEKAPKPTPHRKYYEHKSNQGGHSVSSTPAKLGKQQRDSPFIVESLDSRMTEPPSTEFLIRQKWLRKDKGSFNIQNYDPPKSPSSRYTGTTGLTKRLEPPNKKLEPRSIRTILSSRTSGVDKKSKSISRNIRNFSSSPINSPKFPDHQRPHLDLSENSKLRIKCEPMEDSMVIQSAKEESPIELTSVSSVHIIPPSSHLPEFKYRLPKGKPAKRPKLETGQPILKNETISTDSSLNPPTNDRERPPFRDSNSRQDSTQTKKDSGTLEALSHKDESESSEKITSAQIVPRPLPNSGQIISLYSTDLRGGLDADENAGGEGGELSTQEALHLAQESFQEEFSTPERDLEDISEPKERSRSPSKRITPFSRINTLPSKLEIQLATGVGPEATPNMNTQALIDSVTPFSVGTIRNAGIRLDSNPRPHASASDLRASFAMSPPLSPFDNAARLASNMHTQISGNDSFSALPLTLSVTTPATEQQDGQEIMAATDSFDLSQVIQDAGSWLQQSFDVGKDMKKGSSKGSQSSPQALRREVSPT